jgi:signal transduction histidine kinase
MAEGGAGAGPAAASGPAARASSGPGAEAPPAGALLRAVRAVVSGRTWLAVIHLMSGMVTGLVAFIISVTGAVVGVVLLPFAFAGLPVLVVVLWLCIQFARFERARFAVMLGARMPGPPRDLRPGASWWRRAWRFLASPATLRQFGYALLRFPLSLLQAVIVIVVWSLPLALLGLPVLGWLLPRLWPGADLGGSVLSRSAELAGAAALGLILLLVAPQLTRALAAADIAIARYLIGPGSGADMTARIGELEHSRARVVDAAEAERRRIERDLHDGAQQRLVALAMDLGRAKARFTDDPEGAKAIIDQAHVEAKEALTELRNLVRGVHPPVLTDRGLDAALSGLAALCPVPVTVRADLNVRPTASVEAIAYFVVAEALTNVAKHSRATRAEVSASRHGDVLHIGIRDDGIGGADPRGQGLSGLADRIAGVDGRLSVRSPAGGPTVIEVNLPCGS